MKRLTRRSSYWDLHHTDERAVRSGLPHSVVVWLAFTEVDETNAALEILPGSHRHALPHVALGGEECVQCPGAQRVAPELATHISASHSIRRLRFFTGVLYCRYVLRQAVDPDVLERWLTPAEGGERRGSGGSTLLKLRAGEISIHDCREQSSAAPLRTACCTSNHMVQPVVGHAHLITLLDDRLRRNRPRLGCQPLGSFSLRAQYDILSD